MVEKDRLRVEILSENTGELYSSRRLNNVDVLKLSIPNDPIFKKKQFLIDGARCSTMNFRLNGALSHLCHHYLHYDTLLLHKKDELGRSKRLHMKDFMSVLNLEEKATRRYLNDLIEQEALIKPNNRYRYFVNPSFMIRRGGYICFEEFDMLFEQDPLIIGCLESYHLNHFKNWRRTKSIRTR